MRGLVFPCSVLGTLTVDRLAHYAFVASRDVATGPKPEIRANISRFILLVARCVSRCGAFKVRMHLATHDFIEIAHLHTSLLLFDVVSPPALASHVLLGLRPSTICRRQTFILMAQR